MQNIYTIQETPRGVGWITPLREGGDCWFAVTHSFHLFWLWAAQKITFTFSSLSTEKKQCLSLEFSALTARVSTQFRQVSSVSASLPTVSQRDYSVKLIDKEKQPDKTIPDCSWSTASLSEPEWLEKRRVLEPTGDSYGAILFFTSLFWKSAEFFFSPKGLKTYGMLFHASSVRSMNTWVLENNQPFLWHEDDATQTQ